jgi:hypothetical protein
MPGTITIRFPEKVQRGLDGVVEAEKTTKSGVVKDASGANR